MWRRRFSSLDMILPHSGHITLLLVRSERIKHTLFLYPDTLLQYLYWNTWTAITQVGNYRGRGWGGRESGLSCWCYCYFDSVSSVKFVDARLDRWVTTWNVSVTLGTLSNLMSVVIPHKFIVNLIIIFNNIHCGWPLAIQVLVSIYDRRW